MWITYTVCLILPARCQLALAITSPVRLIRRLDRRNLFLRRDSCNYPCGSPSSWKLTLTRSALLKPYTAVGLIPAVRGIRSRKDIKINLDHLKHLVKAASWLSALDIPVRLIAFPEGALQAFNDEVLDLDHVKFARECAIDIPGEEPEELGKIAREYNAFIMAQAKSRHPDLKDRFFNVGFILDPKGKVILQHYKVSPLFPIEHSVCTPDLYDW